MAGIYLNAFTFVAFVSMILFRFEEKRENKTFFSGRTRKRKKSSICCTDHCTSLHIRYITYVNFKK